MAKKISAIIDEVFAKLPKDKKIMILNYLTLLFKWHKTNNIVSSSDIEYVIKREIYDSYEFANIITGDTFTDIGTGGGIPGILVAILKPNKRVVLLDRKSTFIDFLAIVKQDLGLQNIEIIKEDFFDTKLCLDTEVALFKNFSNKKISKMEFEKKLVHLIETAKNSNSIKKVYMLTGSPVLELSKHFVEEYTLTVKKISSPYFDTFRFGAEMIL